MIRKLLVANRGEIAVRVIRAAREMGIRSVAVTSEADLDAIHTAMADESVCIGGPEPSASYLNIGRIIEAAHATGANAIHPGYGFLAERPAFAEACIEAGLVFVGPSASAMRMLGSKSDAKAIAVQVGAPIVPGCYDPQASVETLKSAALEIGYPIMLKASAGGGGRGMRALHDPSQFDAMLTMASEEARNAFGDGTMMVEKLVERPRHVEVQVLADSKGNVSCLFERECSLQRRHQKLIEEAPSPYLSTNPPMWEAMAESARRLVAHANYVGAATVEFMVDEVASKFYFLEVNTRLQVEHPVTEAVTGLDLVRWQLRIASGESLTDLERLTARTAIQGYAIEARVVAEDPSAGFLPSVGKIVAWTEPRGPGIRVDSGYGPGKVVPRFYDSLLAKVIAHGETRASTIDRLITALLDFHILGVNTNIAYLIDVLDHPGFRSADIDTGFLDREFSSWRPGLPPSELCQILTTASHVSSPAMKLQERAAVWDVGDTFRNTGI